MPNWKTILISSSTVILFLFSVYTISYGVIDIQVDYLWFKSLGYENYFLRKESYINIVDIVIGSIFFLIFLINLRLTERFLSISDLAEQKKLDRNRAETTRSIFKRLIKTRLVRIYIPVSLLLVIPIMIPIHDHWEYAVFFFYGDANTGIFDPAYGRDIGFYLFSYPFYELLHQELVFAFSLLLVVVGFIYCFNDRRTNKGHFGLPKPAERHLIGLILALSAILVWGFLLNRYELLYTSRHEPVFYGPSFIEMRYLLPLIWLECVTFLIATASLILYFSRRKGLKTLLVSGLCFLTAFALLEIEFLPNLVEKYWVQANPVKAESKFMQYNIDSTLSGYGLDKVTTQRYDPREDPEEPLGLDEKQDLNNIPVWDTELLDDVYNQLQAVRHYYNFPSVDVGRYTVEGYYQQVNLSAREINIRKLPDEAKTWENLHLRYTHGYGAVMTPAYQQGEKKMRCFLCGIEMKSPVGIQVKHPEVYYGKENYTYAIVPNTLEPSASDETDQRTRQPYRGTGGIAIQSAFLGKLLFALYAQEPNIFLSTAIDRDSRVLIHRNVRQRIKKLVPFVELDKEPYLVITSDRLYWIQDAYTTSQYYPISKLSQFKFAGNDTATPFNYIRNSLKIVVDAYNGTTRFYIVDEKDPVIMTFQRAFPGLFRTMEQMPNDLKSHLRYPEGLFSIQMKIYAKYHQTKPELFYQESQSWQFAKMDGEAVKPYYVTIHREESGDQIFVMLSPMTPVGLDNLSAIALAGCFNQTMCGTEYSPQLVMLEFPIDVQVDGPGQVSALINQNPHISQKLTLWNQRGSQIKRGRMLILPIANDVFYVQPVYLLSQSRSRIPQLVRVIVSKDKETVIDTSLEGALAQIERLKQTRLSSGKRSIPPVSRTNIPVPYIPPSQRKP